MNSRTMAMLSCLVALGACVGGLEPKVFEPVPADSPYKPVEIAGERATRAERADCEAVGGEIRKDGLAGWERCIQAYPDAGQTCQDSSECIGMCLADGNLAPADAETSGSCQVTDSPFGCYSELRDGIAEIGICVD